MSKLTCPRCNGKPTTREVDIKPMTASGAVAECSKCHLKGVTQAAENLAYARASARKAFEDGCFQ